MGSDVRFLQQLDFPAYAVNLDWLLSDQNLILDGYDLQSSVIVALGTDKLAPSDEPLPSLTNTDRRGWWGDQDADEIWGGWPVGCLLWLLSREKITGSGSKRGSTIGRIEGWTRDAMAPFVTNMIASRYEVRPAQVDTQRIDVDVTIFRGPDRPIELRYSELWDELGS